MEAHAPFDRGRLAVHRRTPKVLEGFSSGSQGCSIGPGGSMPPYGGIPFGDLPAGLGHDTGRAHTSSPVVVPDYFALGRLSKPLGAQPSNPWTVTGLVRLSLSRVQEEPPSLRTEREGGQGSSRLFCPSPSRPFRSDGGCLPSPLVCEPEPLGLGKVAGGAPESLARSERAVRGPPGFWFAPRA